ncbi:probable LRR receptor-like serine/threonine-protein kinase At3g47570 [Mercurialis annua]|uniref:probable LRR receptor-like serine/threonine-protein kinase At3g47570 n=1 Tax=Mercurialis annua TaxID=3986 RepID=UPI00215E7820|nr:probable LRR receptor-like serine/threonine-protein kinase At3g47570 [Mercurialis annua]
MAFMVKVIYQGGNGSLAFTNETDIQALRAIKSKISSDPLKSWNASLHFCKWQGVTCSTRHQRVTVLNLRSLKLVGSLSPHIGNLSFLREIDLGDNLFNGIIPQEIGRLYRLRFLNLSSNSFEGDFPTNITHCSKLERINVLYNNLAGNFPAILGSLSKLTQLNLSKNRFSSRTIPPSFGNLSNLDELSLGYNNLVGSIPVELGSLLNLEFLQLTGNNLTGMIPVSLFNISSIEFFSVSYNLLQGELPADLGLTLPNLEQFYVGLNILSGPFPVSLANASELSYIGLSNNAFTGRVPTNLGNLQNLEYLEIGGNFLSDGKIDGNDDLGFLKSLTNCTNLRVLRTTRNGFRGAFPDSVTNLSTKLTILRLDENHISGKIPSGIDRLINLVFLALNGNLLSGNIPYSVGKLVNLQRLYLSTNTLSGKIPTSIGNLTSLNGLVLSDNKLQGKIPISLANCNFLQGLNLSHNNLTGAIPEQVIGLSSLSLLVDLKSNGFTGHLPVQTGNLKSLGELDISENGLSGEIPNTLGNCLMLKYLYMRENYFQGSIPSSFKQLKSIEILDLSRNNLSGQIPDFLGNFLYFSYLNLSFNNLEGEVPTKGVFRNISLFSVLGNPKLCGGIEELRLSPCPKVKSDRNRQSKITRLVLIIIFGSVFVILLSAGGYAFFYRQKRPREGSPSGLTPLHMEISYAELFKATDGFSLPNLLGEGSFGSVYKGILNTEEEKVVAVKVFNLQERGANRSFLAECEALKNIRHRNLVKIISSCSSIDSRGHDFKALVYEFMPNGSLDGWLHPSPPDQPPQSSKLNLIQRLNIAIDVAAALDYLHHYCHVPVIHCDLKPSNILLDNDLTAHVCDFGLAKLLLAAAAATISSESQTGSAIVIY